jgi:hypothetical protein
MVGAFKTVSKMIAATNCEKREAAKMTAKASPRFLAGAPDGSGFIMAETRIAEKAGPKLAIRLMKAEKAVFG